MGITDVVRAEEHLPNTPKQQMLWRALGHEPPSWAHVPVLVNEQRKKLSKRRDKVALEQYRDEGYLAEAMVNYLMTLGWTPPGGSEIVPWTLIEETFRLEDVNRSPAFFDVKKLAAFNGEYIRRMSADEIAAAVAEELPAGWDPAPAVTMALHLQPRLVTLRDVPGLVDFLYFPVDVEMVYDEAAWAAVEEAEWAEAVLTATIECYEQAEWSAAALKASFDALIEPFDVKRKLQQRPLRVAVTGRRVGPPLFESLEVLGRDETLRRMRQARRLLSAGRSGEEET
jgi:glutamyl-tRNA synthetase